MRKVLSALIVFISMMSAFGQTGYMRPKWIGHPTDSNALLVLAWVPDSSKTMWIEFGGTGNDSITFLTDSVCIIDMGDEICVSIDSVYFTDSTLCYIQLPDTNCVTWQANAVNIYNSNGALTGNRIVDFNGNYLQFRNGSTQPSFLLAPSSSQRFAEIMFHHSGTDSRALLQLANSASGSGAERDAYMRFQSPGPVNTAVGLDHSEGRFVLSDSSNLKNPWLSYSIAGDSLIIPKHLNNSWSGANGGSGQTTRTAYFSNTRTGTSSTNYGLYAVASGGTLNYGVYGNAANRGVWGASSLNGGYGVYGESTNGTAGFGVLGTAAGSAGVGVFAQTTAGGDALYAISTKSNTNTTARTALFSANSTGTAANGFGAYIDLQAETSTTNNTSAGQIEWEWTNATHASRTSRLTLTGVSSATTQDLATLEGDGQLQLNQYGSGTFTGTTAYDLQVTSAGEVIEAEPTGVVAVGHPAESLINNVATDQDYTSLYTIPANALDENQVYRVTCTFEYIAGTSIVSVLHYLKLGSTKVYTTGYANVTDGVTLSASYTYYIYGTAAPSASSNVETAPTTLPIGINNSSANNTNQPVALATNGTLPITPGVQFNGTGSTETYTLRAFVVEKLN